MVSCILKMEVSPPQSNARSSSDFSIESILSDRSKTEERPSWLICTRYQPPRLPRHPQAPRARRSGRHARVPFTAAQASALEAAYSRAPYLAPPALRALAAALQLREDRIKIWFQNRRARERREKCAPIAPPHAVALPPTPSIHRPYLTRYWTQENTDQARQEMRNFSVPTDFVPMNSGHRMAGIMEPEAENAAISVRTDLHDCAEIDVSCDSNDWSDSSLDVETIAD